MQHLPCCSQTFVAEADHSHPNQWIEMPAFSGHNFQDRQASAAKAKQALLEKFRSRPAADDPAVQQRDAERRAVVEARKQREAEKAEKRRLEEIERQKRLAAEEAARVQALADQQRREAEEAELKAAEEAELKVMIEAEKKAERDARYAARKARKAERKGELERYR